MKSLIATIVFGAFFTFCSVEGIAIGLTQTTLLSGSTLTACSGASVDSSTCVNGLASVMQVVRRLQEENNIKVVPFPLLDRQTAFAQMHPLSWAVNILAMEHVGVPYGYMTVPSLFTTENVLYPERWEWFHNTTLKAILSNVDVPASNKWAENVARTLVFDGLGILVLVANDSPNTMPIGPVIRSAIHSLKLDSAVQTVLVYLYDSALTADLVMSEADADEQPDIIVQIDFYSAASYMLNNTKVMLVSQSTSTLTVINVAHGDLSASTTWTESLTVPVGEGDATYYADQAYLDSLAAEAATHDPILGTSPDTIPAHREGITRLCLSGECPIGHLFAESLRHELSTDVGITSSGSFRGPGWPAGPFKISNIWAAMPFANALCYGTARGISLWNVLNYSAALSTAPSNLLTTYGDRLLQVGSIKMTFNSDYTGSRLMDVQILNRTTGLYEPLDRLKLYTYSTDSYVAKTFSPYPQMLNAGLDGEIAPVCTDTIIQNTVTSYMASVGTLSSANLGSIVVLTNATATAAGYPPEAAVAQNYVHVSAACSPGTTWIEGLASCMACAAGSTSAGGGSACFPSDCNDRNTTVIANAVVQGRLILGIIELQGSAVYIGCDGFNYATVLSYNWTVRFDGAALGLGDIASNRSVLRLPASSVSMNGQYTADLTIRGVHGDSLTVTSNLEALLPGPVVMLGGVTTKVKVSPTNIVIPASVTVSIGTVTTAAVWSCMLWNVSGSSCPTSITSALNTATNDGVTIPGPVDVGLYQLTMTYKESFSSTIVIDVQTTTSVLPLFLYCSAAPYDTLTCYPDTTQEFSRVRWLENGDVMSDLYSYSITPSYHSGKTLRLQLNTTTIWGEAEYQVPVMELESLPDVAVVEIEPHVAYVPLRDKFQFRFAFPDTFVMNWTTFTSLYTISFEHTALLDSECNEWRCTVMVPVKRPDWDGDTVSATIFSRTTGSRTSTFRVDIPPAIPFVGILVERVVAQIAAAVDRAAALRLTALAKYALTINTTGAEAAVSRLFDLILTDGVLTEEEMIDMSASKEFLFLYAENAYRMLEGTKNMITANSKFELFINHARERNPSITFEPAFRKAKARYLLEIIRKYPYYSSYEQYSTLRTTFPTKRNITLDVGNNILTIPANFSIPGVPLGVLVTFIRVSFEYPFAMFDGLPRETFGGATIQSQLDSWWMAIGAEFVPFTAGPPVKVTFFTDSNESKCGYFDEDANAWRTDVARTTLSTMCEKFSIFGSTITPCVTCETSRLGVLALLSSDPPPAATEILTTAPPYAPPSTHPPLLPLTTPPPTTSTLQPTNPPPTTPPPTTLPTPPPTTTVAPLCGGFDCICLYTAVVSDISFQIKETVYHHETVTAAVTVQYRSCGVSFIPFLTFRWQLFMVATGGNTEVPLGTRFKTNTSVLTVPALFFAANTMYYFRMTLTAYNSISSFFDHPFTVHEANPTVQLGNGVSSEVRVGPESITIAASVTHPTRTLTTTGMSWSCSVTSDSSASCPAAITDALRFYGKLTGVTIPGPVPSGRYSIRLTYETSWAALILDVATDVVPSVAVTVLSTPVAPNGLLQFAYVPTGFVSFRADVTYAGAVVLQWRLNGELFPFVSGPYLNINMSSFVAGQMNSLTVRAVAASTYGETTVAVDIAAVPTLTITAIVNADQPQQNTALALHDRIRASFSASVASLFGVPLTFRVRFDDVRDGKLHQSHVPGVTVSDGSVAFVAPMPTAEQEVDGNGDPIPLSVTFHVDLLLNQEVLATAPTSFLLHTGSRSGAAAIQSAQLDAATDKTNVVEIVGNMGALLGNATLRDQFAGKAVRALMKALESEGTGDETATNATFTAEQSSVLVGSLGTMVTATTAKDVLHVLQRLTVTSIATASTALDIVRESFTQGGGAKDGAVLLATEHIAISMLASTPIGETTTLQNDMLRVVTAKFLFEANATEIVVSSERSSITVPETGIPGLPVGAVGSIITTEFESDPFVSGIQSTMSSKVVSFSIIVDGTELAVVGLDPPLVIEMESSNPQSDVCGYYSMRRGGVWAYDGVQKVGTTATSIRCTTTHLTAFAGMAPGASTASAIVVSQVVTAAALLWQLALIVHF